MLARDSRIQAWNNNNGSRRFTNQNSSTIVPRIIRDAGDDHDDGYEARESGCQVAGQGVQRVPRDIVEKLESLVETEAKGIACTKLFVKYRELHGELDPMNHGFGSFVELLSTLPHLFKLNYVEDYNQVFVYPLKVDNKPVVVDKPMIDAHKDHDEQDLTASVEDDENEDQQQVSITAARSPGKIYIQTKESEVQLCKIREALESAMQDEEEWRLQTSDIKVHSRYVLKKGGDWFRVKILTLSNLESCYILLYDYGIIETCEIKYLKKLPETFKLIPSLAVCVSLSGVEDCLCKDDIRKFQKFMLTIIRDNPVVLCDLAEEDVMTGEDERPAAAVLRTLDGVSINEEVMLNFDQSGPTISSQIVSTAESIDMERLTSDDVKSLNILLQDLQSIQKRSVKRSSRTNETLRPNFSLRAVQDSKKNEVETASDSDESSSDREDTLKIRSTKGSINVGQSILGLQRRNRSARELPPFTTKSRHDDPDTSITKNEEDVVNDGSTDIENVDEGPSQDHEVNTKDALPDAGPRDKKSTSRDLRFRVSFYKGSIWCYYEDVDELVKIKDNSFDSLGDIVEIIKCEEESDFSEKDMFSIDDLSKILEEIAEPEQADKLISQVCKLLRYDL